MGATVSEEAGSNPLRPFFLWIAGPAGAGKGAIPRSPNPWVAMVGAEKESDPTEVLAPALPLLGLFSLPFLPLAEVSSRPV